MSVFTVRSAVNHLLICLQLLLENLEHEDPFVYLSAVQGNGPAARPADGELS